MKAAIFVCAVLAAQTPTSPQGRMVDVGGRKLHLSCTGTGSPAVVLVGGGGAFAIDWALVQPELALTIRVCSYDRAGLGWSDAGPADETVEQTVSDLHELLNRAGERGPYVLVGASIGGIYIRAYQREFPKDVAALVFTNSANRVGLVAEGANGLLWDLSEEQIRSAFPIQPPAGAPPSRVGEPFDRLPEHLQATRLQFNQQLHERTRRTPDGPASMLSWRKEFLREFDETEAGTPLLGELPVVVVSSDPIHADSARSRDGLAARRLLFSRNTTLVVAKGSGHEIHLYQPETVVQTLRQTVATLRNR
ncbi:MAG TPA: alpha/beta hydrolase [Vicinamibacterales bacterium]|nr:alpha/beta hydrolase [Vicinamibacterales bacterium]